MAQRKAVAGEQRGENRLRPPLQLALEALPGKKKLRALRARVIEGARCWFRVTSYCRKILEALVSD